MFKYWLDVDITASWDKLIAALRHISHVALAEKIKAMTYEGGVGMYVYSTNTTYNHACSYVRVYGYVHT